MEDLRNTRRLRVLRILGGGGGYLGRPMLDACTQVGWKLQEALKPIEITPDWALLFLFFLVKLCSSAKALGVRTPLLRMR